MCEGRGAGASKIVMGERKLQYIAHLMETDDSVDAPADSIKWAKNLFRTRVGQPSLLKRIVAVLTADLAGGRPAFGERSASAAAPRQMLFTAGEYAIDLRITGSKKKFDIRGQVLGKELGDATVGLEGTGFRSSLGENGEFKLSGIPGGKYSLVIKAVDLELVAEHIEQM